MLLSILAIHNDSYQQVLAIVESLFGHYLDNASYVVIQLIQIRRMTRLDVKSCAPFAGSRILLEHVQFLVGKHFNQMIDCRVQPLDVGDSIEPVGKRSMTQPRC